MTENDFSLIESLTGAIIPEVFKGFISKFPSSAQHELERDGETLPCNAELFAIRQLRIANYSSIDLYETQPELRPKRFWDIGGDGCGNHYHMEGDSSESRAHDDQYSRICISQKALSHLQKMIDMPQCCL